jgi:hypothetical protein
MSNSHCRPLFCFVLAALFLATACGVAQPKTLPDGTYQRDEVTGDGTQTLVITLKGGQFEMDASQMGPMWAGSYQVDGNKITFNSDQTSARGKGFCGSKDTFSYQWSFDAQKNQWAFKDVGDTCSIRTAGTVGGEWAYQAPKS